MIDDPDDGSIFIKNYTNPGNYSSLKNYKNL